MLETFFLPVADAYFYQHYDFSAKVSEAMSMAQERFGISLAGPKEFDEKQHNELPLYISSKENDQDNRFIALESHGYIVVSSLKSGEIRLIRFAEETGKEPGQSPAERDAELLANPPPGYRPKVTTSYHYGYRNLGLDDLPAYESAWAFNVNAGNMISNTHVVNFKRERVEEPDSEFLLRLKESEGELTPEAHSACEPAKFSPRLPAAGFAIQSSFSKVQKGEPIMVYGSFTLPDDQQEDLNFVPVHVLVFSREFYEVKTKTFLVPKTKTRQRGNMRLGVFSFDLMQLLFVEEANDYDLSDEIFVTVVSRGVFSQPFRIEIKQDTPGQSSDTEPELPSK